MSEKKSSRSEFLDWIKQVDPRIQKQLTAAAEQADADDEQMRTAANWLLNHGGRLSTDAYEEFYWESECVRIAKKLEIHGDPDRIQDIVDLYEERATLTGEHSGQA